MGSENLSKPDIIAALQTRENRRRKGHIADREERQAFWTKILRGEEKQPAVVGTDAEGNGGGHSNLCTAKLLSFR
jgi:hypothetical protein